MGSELEEARACIFKIHTAQQQGLQQVIIEGDCLALIMKLRKKQRPTGNVGRLVDDILKLSSNFNFCAFSFVKRNGNKIAHALAHLKLYVSSPRVWFKDGPDYVFVLVLDDLRYRLEVNQ